ncbi:hypothetical protein JL09_g6285 [Pichia kudriavzevii]|uniref:Uncharacterized protein n=1 Tax=Pichia kudriavzevii TaxID=4909 RepID=A0A099NRJ7_PICKU|nr:hypothetical protein JL09_g6285 [Pichia kudriavzevii]
MNLSLAKNLVRLVNNYIDIKISNSMIASVTFTLEIPIAITD